MTVPADTSFELKDPWCPARAVVHKGVAKYLVADFWGPNTGPHAHFLDPKGKQFEAAAEHFAQQAATAEQKISEGAIEDAPEFVGEAKRKARQEVLAKAQQAAAASKQRRRVVKLSS